MYRIRLMHSQSLLVQRSSRLPQQCCQAGTGGVSSSSSHATQSCYYQLSVCISWQLFPTVGFARQMEPPSNKHSVRRRCPVSTLHSSTQSIHSTRPECGMWIIRRCDASRRSGSSDTRNSTTTLLAVFLLFCDLQLKTSSDNQLIYVNP